MIEKNKFEAGIFSKDKIEDEYRIDSFANSLINIGNSHSKLENSYQIKEYIIPTAKLVDLYFNSGIAKKIVNSMVEDALRGFIDCDEDLLIYLNDLGFKQVILNAAQTARLYGGSILVAYIDDGRDLSMPLNLQNINGIVKFDYFDKDVISWSVEDLDRDIKSYNYGNPLIYTIKPDNNIDTTYKVHYTRTFCFNGQYLPKEIKKLNNGWDCSVLQSCYKEIMILDILAKASCELSFLLTQSVLKVDGLTNKLSQKDGLQQVTNRLKALDKTFSAFNTAVMDTSEVFERHNINLSGLDRIQTKAMEQLSAHCDMPLTKLIGRSPDGMNSTGEYDLKSWDYKVEAYRNDELKPCIDWIISIIEKQKVWKGRRPKNDKFEWIFKALNTPSESELAEIRYKTAQTDWGYIDRGSVAAPLIYKKRYENRTGEFEVNIIFTQEELKELEDNQVKYNDVKMKAELAILDNQAQQDNFNVNKDSVEIEASTNSLDIIMDKILKKMNV